MFAVKKIEAVILVDKQWTDSQLWGRCKVFQSLCRLIMCMTILKNIIIMNVHPSMMGFVLAIVESLGT